MIPSMNWETPGCSSLKGLDKVREIIEKNRSRKLTKHKKLSNNTLIEIDSCSPLEILKLQTNLTKIANGEGIPFVTGKGKRKPEIQQLYEELEECGERLMQYKECFEIMGTDRNSYSKTDVEATFMRMKEDHMLNGQLKPAYNVQIAVNSEYITGVDVFSNRTDFGTLVPFLKKIQQHHKTTYAEVTADAGYESMENYLYLEENGQTSFIKPANYEAKKTAKFKKQIGRIENMVYDPEEDSFTCAEGRKLPLIRETTELQSGHFVTTAHYRCENCKACPKRSACCQAKDADKPKEVTLKKTFWEKRAASQANMTTERGTYLRMCRSIQVEGAFALLKNDFGFRRFLTRGKTNVRTEIFFLSLAFNLKKLWMKREKGRLKTHLSKIEVA